MSCRLFNVGNTHVLTAELLSDGTLSDYRVFDTPGFDPEIFSDEEMAERKATMKLKEQKELTGYLKRYAKMVSSADKGAIVE